ncbi:hypothetical protein, partial [Staphylococcus xylosus]|uniref:hypothetical protein n=1 Tax=Staphylococcus xylosus TaxID=1288 RepID=UPI001A7E1580
SIFIKVVWFVGLLFKVFCTSIVSLDILLPRFYLLIFIIQNSNIERKDDYERINQTSRTMEYR